MPGQEKNQLPPPNPNQVKLIGFYFSVKYKDGDSKDSHLPSKLATYDVPGTSHIEKQ